MHDGSKVLVNYTAKTVFEFLLARMSGDGLSSDVQVCGYCCCCSNRQHYEIDDWRITGEIIRTAIIVAYAQIIMTSSYSVRFRLFLCSILGFSVKVKLTVSSLCLCMCIMLGKADPKMIYTALAGC